MSFWGNAATLNENNYSFDNETLYKMCHEQDQLTNSTILAGKISMIGRVYAASPERRAYGSFSIEDSGITNPNDYRTAKNDNKTLPNWPTKQFGDGQGGFFSSLAKKLQSDMTAFEEKADEVRQNRFRFDCSEDDLTLLAKSIALVLSLNKMVVSATEAVDEAPKQIKLPNNKSIDVNAKYQISFCSKFLHFHLPHQVFITDSYSNQGGKWLFPKKTDTNCYLLGAGGNGTAMLKALNKEYNLPYFLTILDKKLTELTKNVDFKTEGTDKSEYSEDIREYDYVKHALRAYLVCCLAKHEKIVPNEQISFSTRPSIPSYPRLADCILMNIRKNTVGNIDYEKALQQYKNNLARY